MTTTGLPPIADNGVFSVSASSLIDAPQDRVWSILTDFKSYSEWNSFVRQQFVCDASKRPLDDQAPTEGKYLSIAVHLPPTMGEPGIFGTGSAFVQITALDHENHRAAWATASLPSFILHSERWQALSVDPVTGKTKYETIEVFNGLAAYLVRLFVGSKLKLGFQAMADDLKHRAEES
ncbi:hypothetical protein BDQ17DRAFT_1360355 [Cyathus striatus]|nr:hypothetical protein BDQ17DRAFT_1360355 [Cyathus striatus]